jgi:hydroxyacylglutathione hydrolase
MALMIVQFRCRKDNYGVLVHDEDTGTTASIDAPDADTVCGELDRRGWRLDLILTTHHHGDHTAGNLALKQRFGCTIVGPGREADSIPGIDTRVGEGDVVPFAGRDLRVLATPGHTLGHVAYHLPAGEVVFVGDTLFAMGCGRLLEGTAAMMWESLRRLLALPEPTHVYCGHDYAAANARFALTIDPDNEALATRAEEAASRAARGELAPPTTIAAERATNPFLRADQPDLATRLGLPGAPAVAIFAEIRRRKDRFG